jgi:hypothetical protein
MPPLIPKTAALLLYRRAALGLYTYSCHAHAACCHRPGNVADLRSESLELDGRPRGHMSQCGDFKVELDLEPVSMTIP